MTAFGVDGIPVMLALTLQSSWLVLGLPAAGLCLVIALLVRRRIELRHYERSHRARTEAIDRGSHKARLQYPDIDLSQCIGCGACVRACPEDGVLDLLHGQAVVVHGARCVGHGLCAQACPTAAIALTLGDLADRRDLPAIEQDLEAVGAPGLFIAGELSGYALVKTAVTHGAAVADAVAASIGQRNGRATNHPGNGSDAGGFSDLLIVGLGPAGLSCALRSRELGLDFTVIEQSEQIGGAVAAYPRRKLVMSQPVRLPIHGEMTKQQYVKEELIDLWRDAVETNDLPIRTGVRLDKVSRGDDGVFTAQTSAGTFRARSVCLALGRRGTPRTLGVPGEDLPKVAYSLLDAESYTGRRILVVGGGDSAVEAAIGLSEQPGNDVTLCYRKKDFFRLKARNDTRVRAAISRGKVNALFCCDPVEIRPGEVTLRQRRDDSDETGETLVIPNDDVFVFAGGKPPFDLLRDAGVSFDPEDRPEPPTVAERSTALLAAVSALLVSAVAMLVWVLSHAPYYGSPLELRRIREGYDWLRPGGPFGLTLGILACVMFVWNLTFLLRRSRRFGRFIPGSMRLWMNSHVFTGLFSGLCVVVHAGFTFRVTSGGFAFCSLFIVITSGVVGRYFYAFVPRAANGREIDLGELRAKLGAMSAEWDRSSRGFGAEARLRVDEIVDRARWRSTLPGRIRELIVGQFRLRATLRRLRARAHAEDIAPDEVRDVMVLARRAYRLTLQITHYEEIRALLSTWRYFHRWLALLMVLLVITHIVTALRYANLALPEVRDAAWGAAP
ncbi:MAG: NAD(P)-binding domain-containing protein [Phycisphaeraceae bacterium]|nr:NAD(P)-binding domain-containing protein [Phycisphaeraceae bacterium]MCB9847785.1 NAD(P)-binding domain-containing protein [Phycisphaeraceae bacterium]